MDGRLGCLRRECRVSPGNFTPTLSPIPTLHSSLLPPRPPPQGRRLPSLDHLVGERQQGWWNCKSLRLCGPEIDDELEPGRLHHRHVGGLGALEDSACIFRTISDSLYARARRRPGVTMFWIFEARTLQKGRLPGSVCTVSARVANDFKDLA